MSEGEELRCPSCGAVLARVITARRIAVDGSEFPYTRSTDHLLCDCGEVVPVHAVRADLPLRDPVPGPQRWRRSGDA